MVRLSVLGGAALQRDGDPVVGAPAQRHHLAILAYLAASPGCQASRDKLIGCLWPERDSAKARHRLSVALHVLRQGLGEDTLTAPGDAIALNRSRVQVDLCDFMEALEAGRLEDAVGLYGGPFLDGFFLSDAAEFEEWVDGERRTLSGLYRSALEQLATAAQQTGDLRASVQWWRRLAAHDRYSSSAALGLMRALAATGDAAAAVSHARIYATLVEGELGVPADPEVAELADELVKEGAARKQAAAAAKPSAPVPTEGARTRAGESPKLHPEPASQDLRIARAVAGWVALAVLVTLVLAAIFSMGSTRGPDTASEPAVDASRLSPEGP